MSVSLRLDNLKTRTTKDHMDLFKSVEHTIAAIDKVIEEHDKFVAEQSIAGIKPDGKVESVFHEAMYQARDIVITNFEKTLDDFEHKYDKTYQKNFKDGVE